MIVYDVVTLDLDSAGRQELQELPEGINTLSAAIPSGAAVYARLGRREAPRINLAVRPLLRSDCGGFGVVVLEWDAAAGETAEILLSQDLESAVVVA